MAKETITRLVDDLDGGVAHETVTFGLDGHLYEIDLSPRNAKKLRTELAVFVEHGSRVTARAATPGRRGGGSSGGPVIPTRTGPFGSGRRRRATRSPNAGVSSKTSWTHSTRPPDAKPSRQRDGPPGPHPTARPGGSARSLYRCVRPDLSNEDSCGRGHPIDALDVVRRLPTRTGSWLSARSAAAKGSSNYDGSRRDCGWRHHTPAAEPRPASTPRRPRRSAR